MIKIGIELLFPNYILPLCITILYYQLILCLYLYIYIYLIYVVGNVYGWYITYLLRRLHH